MSEEKWVSPFVDIGYLKGKVLTKVDNIDNDQLIFYTQNGEQLKMYHMQDCCENVFLADVCGEWEDIIDEPILDVYETTNRDEPPITQYAESYTWTFYHIRTMSGTVTLRWYGESNGYYGESVSIEKIV